jgi:lysine biosynthesis protein LysW
MREASLSRNRVAAPRRPEVKMPVEAQEVSMSRCPECDSDLELDGYDVDVGETIHCPECSVELKVTSIEPIGVELAEEEESK